MTGATCPATIKTAAGERGCVCERGHHGLHFSGSLSWSATRSDGLGEWHTQPPGWAWRLRDRFARLFGFHCWDCMVTK